MNVLMDHLKDSFLSYADKAAFIDHSGKRVTTYRQLDEMSGKIARGIIEKGCKKGAIIPVLMPRCTEYIAAEIGIMKAGCAFAPLITDYPKDRVAYIKKDCNSSFVIDKEFVDACINYAPYEEIAELCDTDKGFVIYTSGSTGSPKGIIHSQRSLYESLVRQLEVEQTTDQDICLSTITHSFSVSVPENYVPLLAGATIVMLNDEERKDVRFLETAIEQYGITNAYINPTQLKVYKNKSKTLKTVKTVGERLCNQYSDAYKMINIYGASETLLALAFTVDKSYDNTPIGKPVSGISVYILDENGHPVRDGEEGELCVAGAISDGYLNLPNQTAKAYRLNPYATCDADKILFHTNDIVKRLDDGNIIYVNRKDWMVKINGQRVEVGEIEVCSQNVSGVEEAVVKAFVNDYGQNYLVEYFKGENVTAEAIKRHLRTVLPDYMIPLFFVKLSEFPLNANGKINRLALEKPDASMYKAKYVAPKNATEKLLCEKFEEVLHCGKVGINDSFFDLGGDSIKVMMLQNACEIPGLSTDIIFECKTPERISENLIHTDEDIIAGCVGVVQALYPLTPSQMGVYLACIKNPQGTMYNTPCCYTFSKTSKINIGTLGSAVEKAVRNHEAFCFMIDTSTGTPMMRRQAITVDIPVITTTDTELANAKKAFVKPFDLTSDQLFRFAIFETETVYCFAMDFHHIAFDGTSVAVICNEISLAYNGQKIEKERFGQFALSLYEQRLEETEKYREAEKYFDKIFDGLEVSSRLAADFQEDETVANKPCKRFTRFLSNDLSNENVSSFVKAKGITENTLFFGACQYAVAKFTGQNETVVCTVNHGRHDGRMKNTIGMMVRTLPVYTKFDEDTAVVDYLVSVENNLRASIKNDSYPFVKLATKYGLDTDIMFVYQSDAFNSFELAGETLDMESIPVDSAQAPLSIMIFKSHGGFEIEFQYRSDLYEQETIQSFADMLVLIIREMMKKATLSEIDLVSPRSREKIFEINRQTETDCDLSIGFIDLFREQVKLRPDKTALVFKENRYTYKELDAITDKIAKYLHDKGYGAEDAVAVLVERCEYMTICAIGVLKSGAAYEPLDPTHPSERLQFMIKDANVKIMIADEKLLHLVPDFKGEILKISEIATLPACNTALPSPAPEDLFVLLYTSGSTGVPKGCMLNHRNITNFIHWGYKIFEITDESSTAAYASYGFDAHMMDIYPFLSFGATEYIIPEEKRLDLVWINDYCAKHGITSMFMTTQVGRAFITSIDNIALKIIGTGGEKLVPFTPVEGIKVYNLYGPTECTIITTAFHVDKYYDPLPVGKAVDNTHLYVVDKQLRMLPVGAVGELCVAGPLVSRGYLNRPEQTEKVYVKNPFENRERYGVLYHTGDIVKFMNDGNLSYVGRRDGMVKIRGYRIELTEVEAVIREFDGIKDATVVAKDKPAGGKYIAAYVVSDGAVDIDSLKSFIAEKKPPFMVPEAIMQLDSIPLNVNGKVDRRKLPEMQLAAAETAAQKTEHPLTLLQKKILDIIEKIIGTKEIDVSADLMHCGMTSLTVIKLAVELNKVFGYNAEIQTLMKGCSVLSLESEIVQNLLTARKNSGSSISAEKAEKEYVPLSYTQYGVYAECMKHPYDTFYNIPFCYKFPASFRAEKLAKAVTDVLAAHPYVFTRIGVRNDDVVQIKQRADDFTVPVKKMPEHAFEKYRADFVKPYKLMNTQLFKVEVIETEKSVYLFAEFHHIIFDGASFGLFAEAVKDAYEGKEIEAETYDYFDYVRAEAENRSGAAFKAAETYISNMLSKCESADEITPDLGGLPENGKPVMLSVPFDMHRISKFCNEIGITPAHLFLASMLYVVSRFTNSRNAYINTISNGRTDIKLRNCFGMFVKTLPIGIEIGDVTALELVKAAKELLVNAVSNEIYPYADVCRKFNYAPNILYAYQLGVSEDLYIDQQKIENDAIGERRVKFKTAVYIEKNNGQESINVLYNDALYSQNLMEAFANAIAVVTEKIIADPHQKVRKISMLNEKGAAVIEAFSQTEFKEPEIKLLHALFEKQVALHPDTTALIACDGKFTYSQLDKRANSIANNLIARGIKNGSKVVILLKRTSGFFAALFGILKAGCAFIPTCPEYPQERIESIIEDSEAELVITFGELLKRYDKTVDIEELEKGDNHAKPVVAISPEDLAYLIYTSGSTGKPKGVMLRHIGIASYLTDHERNIQIRYVTEACKCYGSITTISFDMSLKETVGALCNGLTLAFASDEQTVNPAALAQFFEENHVDAFNATPSRLLLYMELPEFAQAMKNCKVILSGGENYPDKLLQVLREKTDAKIINTYGPTEITVSSNAKELTYATEISVGRPLLNYKEYIVDLDDNKLPVGVVGELLIGGLGVALGYNKLPEQTEKAFIHYEGQRFYRSGDYAKWMNNGDVVILGRKDNQVKLRGLRIELGEIEKCLTNIAGIRSAVVVIKKLGNEDGICAYYTAEKKMDVDALKAEMRKTLTEYMIPASFNQLEELPLTPNGKVNIRALCEPALADKADKKIEKPATEVERQFCQIFSEILNVEKVSATDNFFDLGGTSLTVTRVVIAASKHHYSITYGDVFENPTPRMLAKLAGGSQQGDNGFDDFANYDYTAIDKVLEKNTLDSFLNGEKQTIGDVLLTGAVGFLGIHILYELLKNHNGKVYCLLRSKKNESALDRMKSIFFYYFEVNIMEEYGERVEIIEGDITDKNTFENLKDIRANIFINCAANVKHFSKGTDIEDVNYHGVQNILAFCKATGIRLVHVSTMSVGGMFVDKPGKVTHLKENLLYYGQVQGSKYTNAKFLAEREILENIAQGMNAKIMRVGTLAARESDGEYQINFTTNSFMGRLKSTFLIGCYPYETMDMPFELSPIDYVAKAILLLAQTPKECTVFHPYNNHSLIMSDLYAEMNRVGLYVHPVENNAYIEAVNLAKEDPEKAKVLSSFIAYQNIAHGRKTYDVAKSNLLTMQVLYRMHFKWPVTSLGYMKRFLMNLQGLGYFEEK